jgi:hypothetical protein
MPGASLVWERCWGSTAPELREAATRRHPAAEGLLIPEVSGAHRCLVVGVVEPVPADAEPAVTVMAALSLQDVAVD